MGGNEGGSMQYWFESAKSHWWNKGKYPNGPSFMQSVHAPMFGTHRQDMQGITNVEVMCCDGHTELAIKGDNGPNESSIENTTYDLSKDDLNHILGCVGFCSIDRYRTGASAWAANGTIVLAPPMRSILPAWPVRNVKTSRTTTRQGHGNKLTR